MIRFLLCFVINIIYLTIPSSTQTIFVTEQNNPSTGYLFLTPLSEVGHITCYDNALHKPYESVYSSEMRQLYDLKMISDNRFVGFVHPVGYWLVFDNDFQILDTIPEPGQYNTDFHDIQFRSNGDYYLFTERMDTVDMSVVVPGGKERALVRNMVLYGFNSADEIIFQWESLDHLDVTDATEDVDLTQNVINPFHFNSIDFDNEGNIIVSARNMDAIIKIDRTNGNIIWMMGGSKSNVNQFSFINDTKDNFFGFSHQHMASYLSNGNILLFDNGNLKPEPESRVVEYQINESNMTATKVFEYYHSPAVFSGSMGSAQRLANGNTFIGWGGNSAGDHNVVCSEITPDGETTFEVLGSVGVYRAYKFPYKIDYYVNNVNSSGNYNFNGNGFTTGININFQYLEGTGQITVEKHRYQPHYLSYEDGAACNILPYRWIVMSEGIDSLRGQLKIATSAINNPAEPSKATIFYRTAENNGNFIPLETSYNQSGSYISAIINGPGEFMVALNNYANVVLENPGNNQIAVSVNPLLKWRRVQQDEYYDIQLSLDPNFNNLVMSISGHNSNQILIDGLQNGTKYYWRVKAMTESCTSEWSSPWCFSTTVAAPVLVLPADGSKEQPVNINFSWAGVTSATKYRFQLSEDISFLNLKRDLEVQNASYLYINGLENNTKYFWRVAGWDQVYGAWSAVFSFQTVMTKPVLSYPENNSAGICLNTKLIWYTVKGAGFYNVLVSSDEQFREIVLDATGIAGNELGIKDLKPLTYYFWRVKAVNDGAMSDWSETGKFRTTMPNPELVSPSNLSEKIKTTGFLIWHNIPEAEKYEILLSKDSNFIEEKVDEFVTKNTWHYLNLDKSTVYYWKVKSFNQDGNSEWSLVFSFTTAGEMDLLPPDPAYPQNESSTNELTIGLKWNDDFDGIKFEIELALDIDFRNIIFSEKDISENIKFIENLKYNTKYFWRLRSIKDEVISSWSEIWCFTTKLRTTSLVSPGQNEQRTSTEPVFMWNASEGAIYYNFELANDFSFFEIIDYRDNLRDTSYQSSSLEPDRAYYWRVRPRNEGNSADWSVIGEFKTAPATTVTAFDNPSALLVFPNPAAELININISSYSADNYKLNIFSSEGRLIGFGTKQISSGIISIDVSKLSSGLYLIELISADKIYYSKFIKL